MSSRSAQKAEARATRVAAEQAEAAGAARRRRVRLLAGVLGAAAVILLAAILVSRAGTDEAPKASERAAIFDGIAQDGEWLGDPGAPVVVEEYADLQCPFCAQFATGDLPAIVNDYVRPGRVRMRMRVLTFLGAESVTAGQAVAAAGLQDRQWQFAEELYAEQGAENSGWVTDDFLRERGEAVPGLDVGRALGDRSSPEVARALEDAQAAATEAKVESTPSFRVGRRGEDMETVDAAGLRAAVDAALAER